jgi:L-alanine-DL-glutamate epimerase-like enolase superfamily enzyme
MQITLEKVELPLRVLWKISRNETQHKTNYYVCIEESGEKYYGEVAPNIRYGETPELIQQQFQELELTNITSFQELDDLLEGKNLCKSLEYGVESAFVHYFAASENKSISEFLGLEEVDRVETSLSIPIMNPSEVEAYLEKFEPHQVYKLKVDHDTAFSLIQQTLDCIGGARLRIDANEGWNSLDDLMELLAKFPDKNIEFIEQPFPSNMQAEYRKLYKIAPYPIMADESILDIADFAELSKEFHWVNIKLMKTGSYFRAIKLLTEAKKHGMKCMLGCMIESSVGIESAINLASLADAFDLDGALLLKEDPKQYVKYENGFVLRTKS